MLPFTAAARKPAERPPAPGYNRAMRPLHRLDAETREQAIAGIARALAGRRDLRFATVFGSALERDAVHDLDVGIWTTAEAGRDLDLELAGSLSAGVGLPVDVRRLNEAPVAFLFQALRGRVVAVQDEGCLAEVMERTARVYHDLAPRLRQATRDAFAR
jgi:predicted nucleotidyltransferase